MSARRSSSKEAGAASSPDHPVRTAILMLAALSYGFALLIQRGRLTWPPLALLSSLSTLAGCVAFVGPLVLARTGGKDASLGEMVWLTGGLLVWLFDAAAVLAGSGHSLAWATPLGDRTMGLAILAVLLAGWRCGLAGIDWSWTNITGWILGLFWVGIAAGSWLLTPAGRLLGLVAR
jgi:hypothetical protein